MSTTDLPSDMSNSEELVAYLDGEMPPDDCRRVEQRLSADAAYRRELAELDQAWSALDELPPPVVTDDFARTTIEMVAVVAERDLAERSATDSTRGRRCLLLAAALCGILAAAGYAAVHALLPDSNDRLLADLPVIAHLDVLTEIGDIEFLRGLSGLGPDRFIASNEQNVSASEPAFSSDAWDTLAGRRAWIEQLSADEQAELAVTFSRFQNLPSNAERQRLRQLHDEIATADNSPELHATLAAYGPWIKNRTPGERIALRELPPGERLGKVADLIERNDRLARQRLSPADEKALQEAILDFVDRRQQEFIREIRRQGDAEFQPRVERRTTAVVALAIIRREMRDDRGRDRLQDFLLSRLSPAVQEYLESLPGRRRRWQLWRWCSDALDPRFGPSELEKYFVEELDNDDREYLLGLPQAEMEERLEQLYVGSQVGFRGREWLGNDGPDGVRRGGPGPLGPGRNPGDADERGRGRGDRFPGDGPPPDAAGRRRPPPRDVDERRPDGGRFDRSPNGPPPGRRGEPPPEAI